ncbi:hypothetical protein [Actinomadura gamaensis]|uniref:Mce-associated membrane protein n=1 Tax=Actinomadura gamaensis TaxID=1763541 RepID=A0ABV9U314_9ACTN
MRPTAQVLRPAARVLLALAVVFLGWAGWSLWQAYRSPLGDLGKDRDTVLRVGSAQVAALNSMDWTRPDDGLKRWQDASTGPLRDQLQREAAADRQKIVQGRTAAAASVDAAAVTSLDDRSGVARLVAAVRITLTPSGGGAPTVQRKRYEAGLARTPAGWRLQSLTVIPVSAR